MHRVSSHRKQCCYKIVSRGATVFAVALIVSMLLASCNSMSAQPATSSSGRSSPWATQLSVAQQAAFGIDKNAVLETVVAGPDSQKVTALTNYSSIFLVTFRFVDMSGRYILVSLRDSSPASTVQTMQDPPQVSSPRKAPASPRIAELTKALSLVHIGPREAGQNTWQYVHADINQKGIRVSPSLVLDLETTPPVWVVLYTEVDSAYTGYTRRFTVDAQTGRVLSR